MEKMTMAQLKNEIALSIRENKLNNFLSMEDITKRVVKKIQESENFRGLIPELENPTIAKQSGTFPQEEELKSTVEAEKNETKKTVAQSSKIEQPIDQLPPPEKALEYVPELPDMIKNVENGKLIVFDYNEIDENGENLSNKPFRTFEDPDIKRSIKEMWLSEAKRGAEIYIAKFEKIGDLTFDYINGVANFQETPPEPAVEPGEKFKENPYKTESTPQMMQTSVDVEAVTQKIIMDLLKKALGVNSNTISDPGEVERVLWNDENHVVFPEEQKNVAVDGSINPLTGKMEQMLPTRADNQECQPKDSRITDGHENPEELGFVVKESVVLNDLVDVKSDFYKVDTPKQILESLKGKNDKTKVIQETKEVKGWELDGKKYYLPTNYLSAKKCYIKK